MLKFKKFIEEISTTDNLNIEPTFGRFDVLNRRKNPNGRFDVVDRNQDNTSATKIKFKDKSKGKIKVALNRDTLYNREKLKKGTIYSLVNYDRNKAKITVASDTGERYILNKKDFENFHH